MIILIWLLSGLLAGLLLDVKDYFDGVYDTRPLCPSVQDIVIHLFFSLLGPAFLLAVVLYLFFVVVFSDNHDWTSRPICELFRRKK